MKITKLRSLSFPLKKLFKAEKQACKIVEDNYCKETATLFMREIMEYNSLEFGAMIYPMGIYVMTRYTEVVAIGAYRTSPMDDSNFEIYWINTKKEYQRRGYATKMVNFLLQEIDNQDFGYYNVLLSCRHNKVAFYKKFGFEALSKSRVRVLMVKKS